MIYPVGRPTVERLGAHLRAGTLLDLIPHRAGVTLLDESEMQAWDVGHDIDADVLREMLRGRGVFGEPDPRGLQLRGARIRGRLDLDHVRTTIALRLTDCLLEQGITAIGACLADLALTRCRISSPTGPAINGADLSVDGSLRVTESSVEGCGARPSIDLTGAAVTSHLSVSGSTVLSRGGDAAVRLRNAEIGGALTCSGATLDNATGPALDAERLRTRGAVVLSAGFAAHGHGPLGAVRLAGALIGGPLDVRAALLGNTSGPALDAEGLTTGGDLLLDDGFTATGSGENGTIRLVGAHVGGRLCYRGAVVRRGADPAHRWTVDGLVYAGVPAGADPAWDCDSWLQLLRTATPAYAAQPYRQLASAYRAQGHDSAVRAILIAQRRDQLARGALPLRDRCWGHLTGWLLGYGYRCCRALWALLGVLAASVALALVLGPAGALARVPDVPAQDGMPCTVVQTIGNGLGAPLLPAFTTGPRSCTAMTTPAGDVLTVATWMLRVAAWTLAALFVAGFTGIVRRT